VRNREGREFDSRLPGREKSRSKDRPLQLRGNSSDKNWRGPMVPTGRGKSTARIGCATEISTARIDYATEMPGWRGEELLRL
jgi:hypothetical protein